MPSQPWQQYRVQLWSDKQSFMPSRKTTLQEGGSLMRQKSVWGHEENKEARSLHALLHAVPFADWSSDYTLLFTRWFKIGFMSKAGASAFATTTLQQRHALSRRICVHNGLSLRRRTTVCQRLPETYEEKQCISALNEWLRTKHSFLLGQIGNADQTPLWFDMPSKRTVSRKWESKVRLLTSGNTQSRFMVMLCCTEDGHKLPPFLLFKRKTMPTRENFLPKVVVRVNEKGFLMTKLRPQGEAVLTYIKANFFFCLRWWGVDLWSAIYGTDTHVTIHTHLQPMSSNHRACCNCSLPRTSDSINACHSTKCIPCLQSLKSSQIGHCDLWGTPWKRRKNKRIVQK